MNEGFGVGSGATRKVERTEGTTILNIVSQKEWERDPTERLVSRRGRACAFVGKVGKVDHQQDIIAIFVAAV